MNLFPNRFLFPILLFLGAVGAQAQVSGVVTDQVSGKAIEKADVFINSTTLSSITNDQGEFQLDGIAPGFSELVIYKNGYQLFKSSLRIQPDKVYKLNLQVSPLAEKSKATKIKPDEEYKKNMQWFERGLLGTTTNTAACKIVNPKAILLVRTGDVIHVTVTEPLIIENSALGYRIKSYLQDFDAGVEDVHIQGAQKFDTLSSRDFVQRDTWKRNRLKSYWGSERHLFYALLQGRAGQEGFDLTDTNGKKISPDTLVGKGRLPGYSKIKLNGKTQVRYQIEKGTSGIQQTDKLGQISWIQPKESVEVSQDGLLFNRKSIEVTGDWAQSRLADLLPDNYFPTSSIDEEKMDWQNFGLLREKVYLHTDRDYYYPRENIWFKVYMGYSMPVLRDTLSRTLYVELVDPQKTILQSKTYRINRGVTWGDFKLADSLQAGEYYLRAYTNWMRNYGDSALFVKSVPILDYAQNLEATEFTPTGNTPADLLVKVQPNQNEFKKRERVELSIEVFEGSKPINSQLSVSVVDALASARLPNHGNILDPAALSMPKNLSSNSYFDQIEHFMERGLSFKGAVKDEKANPAQAEVEIIQGNMENLISMATDDKGEFLVTGLNFTDSMTFAFKPTNKKGKLFKRVEIVKFDPPEFLSNPPTVPLKVRKDNALQRIQNSFIVDDNTILLNEVEVKAKRIVQESQQEKTKMYGNADYVVSGQNLRATAAGTNFLVSLQGKVPGLQVTDNADGSVRVRIRGGTSSLSGNTEPFILVDGVPFPDVASIRAIDPSQVDRVEVITRAVAQFGSRGTNGVIAIYTKSGVSGSSGPPDYLAKKIMGYNTPRVFASPEYATPKDDTPDFRTTIYWQPSITTNPKATVTFYTADLPGEYRIIVEGVTDQGKPVRGEAKIIVN
jgi:TonB-dependent Receptor Plug Domain/CarboxypepD_reg-like domain